MAILLVALTLFVFYAVGRIAFGIVKYRLDERKPRKSVEVEGLGTLTSSGPKRSLWCGRLANPPVAIYLAGTADEPNAKLISNLKEAVQNLPELRDQALAFIVNSNELKALGLAQTTEKVALESLDFLWEEKPELMSMEFGHSDDNNGVFRVDFENRKPVRLGYDD